MAERDESMHNMVVHVTATELAKVHALAKDRHETISTIVRTYIREAYTNRFGAAPPPAPTLKGGRKLKLPKQ